MDGLYFDENIVRYLFGFAILTFLSVWMLLNKNGGRILKLQAWCWLALALAQLSWSVPVISQEPDALLYANVVGFSLYMLTALGAGIMFGVTYFAHNRAVRQVIVWLTSVYSLIGIAFTWFEFDAFPPHFSEAGGLEQEYSVLFRGIYAGAHLLFLPVGIYIIRHLAPVSRGITQLVSYVYGLGAILTAAAGFVFLAGGEEAAGPLYAVVILCGVILIVSSMLRTKRNQSVEEATA